jgi:hypothetical protein
MDILQDLDILKISNMSEIYIKGESTKHRKSHWAGSVVLVQFRPKKSFIILLSGTKLHLNHQRYFIY